MAQNNMYSATTRNITVTVIPTYLPAQSDTQENLHTWMYFIRLENKGEETVQLINRYWHITDGRGFVQEVRGAGVVGNQPILAPNSSFDYNSGVSLNTTSGIMKGHYEMHTQFGEIFNITIPAFSLDSPEQKQRPN